MKKLRKILSIFFLFTFLVNSLGLPSLQAQPLPQLPAPGVQINLSPAFSPTMIQGIKIFPQDPFRFDFIVDTGDSELQGEPLKKEADKLIKYFLASLTVPEDQLWVNLSPYEKDRIVPNEFGTTEMGRDLLAQDYLLKQLTASLLYPEGDLGKKFWDKVYKTSSERYGTTDIPVNTLNRVWIVPDVAGVYEQGDRAFIVESRMKVMMEEDFVNSKFKNQNSKINQSFSNTPTLPSPLGGGLGRGEETTTAIIREIILPSIEKEINEGKNFAPLRQMYHAMILSAWFKRNLKKTLLGKVYANRKKNRRS